MLKEFTKPHPIVLMLPQADGTSTPAKFSVQAYLGQYIWSYSKWNTEDGWGDAQIRIGDAIDEAAEGSGVRLQVMDWEKLREANNAAEIKGDFAHKIRRHQRAIKMVRDLPDTQE